MKKQIIITTGVIAVAGGLITALTMPSCGPECEVAQKPSVVVQVVDKDAAQATVTSVRADEVWYEWTTDDGEVVKKPAECANDDCSEWVLGDGQPGIYAIHAKVCGREFNSSVTLELNDEGCEVDTQIIDLSVSTMDCPDIKAPVPTDHPVSAEPTLPPTVPPWVAPNDPSCTMEARFSVVAQLWAERDGRMVPIGADRAYYIHDPSDEDGHGKGHDKAKGQGHEKAKGEGHHKDERDEEIPAICLDADCMSFAAGIELEGEFIVGAEACGQVVEATVEVGRTEDGCHVATQDVRLAFDGTQCRDKPVYQPTPQDPKCPTSAPKPSAFLMPAKQEGDMLIPQLTSSLTYLQADAPRERQAYCAQPRPNDLCGLWIAGWGLTGDFQAFTQKCGVETAISYSVEPTEDGCGPQTKYVLVNVDTRGCIQPPSPKGNPPPNTMPAAEDVTNK